jgi:hypothetical protein
VDSSLVPASEDVPWMTSSMSLTIAAKSAVSSGWKTIPAAPLVRSPSWVSNVT